MLTLGNCNNEDFSREQERHSQLSRTIPVTKKLYSFVPISESDVFRKERVALAKNEVSSELIAGFITC